VLCIAVPVVVCPDSSSGVFMVIFVYSKLKLVEKKIIKPVNIAFILQLGMEVKIMLSTSPSQYLLTFSFITTHDY